MFDTVLIANRGEIAVRVIRTLRSLGVRAVAVYSDADAGARHVREADLAVRLGPAAAQDSYLNIGRILDAVAATGAQAVHPGYGFLAENAAFAQACADAGVVFVGPSPHAIAVMGDKIRAKQTVSAAGVPVVPGASEQAMDDQALIAAAAEVGFPVLVKPSKGGGGKGMRLVERPEDLPAAIAGARREARSSFGDDTLFLERFVLRPRHIEVQVLADNHATVVHLGERECSLQRRHQKVIEEAPSPLLGAASRLRIGEAACRVARSVGYSGAGTVEFIVSSEAPEEFFFMEMNTRLQVEHPVTEMVTGIDLVEAQLRVAAGEPLGFDQPTIRIDGHAIEARIYAEDPGNAFLPTAGQVAVVREPSGPGIRVDSSLLEGVQVATAYDPMLAKIVAWGPDRPAALARLDAALAGTVILGLGTNTGFLRSLIAHPDVAAGRLDTGLIERELPALLAAEPPDAAYAAYALYRLAEAWPIGPTVDLWDVPSGWRPQGARPLTFSVVDKGPNQGPEATAITVGISGTPTNAEVTVGNGAAMGGAIARHGERSLVAVAGTTRTLYSITTGATTWVAIDGRTWAFTESSPHSGKRLEGGIDVEVRSPMPGSVVAVLVETGSIVAAGLPLVIVEAMKMEHTLHAPGGGTVELLVNLGDQVRVDQVLARVDPVPAAAAVTGTPQ